MQAGGPPAVGQGGNPYWFGGITSLSVLSCPASRTPGPDPAPCYSAAAEDKSRWWWMNGNGQVMARPGCSSCASLVNPWPWQAMTTLCKWQRAHLEKPNPNQTLYDLFPSISLQTSKWVLLDAVSHRRWIQVDLSPKVTATITRSTTAPLAQFASRLCHKC